jgi:spectinomycin phosphotransferase
VRTPPPTDVEERVVAQAIANGWGVQVRSLQYMPVGGGGYHWHAIDTTGRSLFITVDDLDTKDWLGDDRDAVERGLIASLDTSHRLRHDANLGFVVAPLVSDAGRSAMRLGDRYAVSVYPYLRGRSHPFSLQSDPARRDRTLSMLIALHTADPPVGVLHHERPHISGRAHLEAFLRDPADPWNEGPFGERARALFAPYADQLRGRLDRFDRVAQRVPTSVVVTHGEPHGANLMTLDDVLVLIDWDTVGLAAPERDLWLVGLDEAGARIYADATGHQPDPGALALYRERWNLDDLAHVVEQFRGPHQRDPDSRRWLRELPALLASHSTALAANC